ncbi:MAG TPA: alcohol dehydrogenase catalytic domain-containing protein [Solirubrobacterales bacterium]|nr:alcohol dehydrogenase catalytic domain-containing protein [Solirubrobacterales bacterium]
MRATVLERAGEPLRPAEMPNPRPGPGQVLISVGACGVCRTDLHNVDGELDKPKLPLVPGHQIVGEAVEAGKGAERFEPGERAGCPGWAGPVASAATASRAARTSATALASPAMTSTAATPLMTTALRASAKGARIISAGIHMSDIPSFPYEQLWGECTLGSVANLTRQDGEEFLAMASEVPVHTEIELHSLEGANETLDSIRSGSLHGAAVLKI